MSRNGSQHDAICSNSGRRIRSEATGRSRRSGSKMCFAKACLVTKAEAIEAVWRMRQKSMRCPGEKQLKQLLPDFALRFSSKEPS
jgi:hypothetical protein